MEIFAMEQRDNQPSEFFNNYPAGWEQTVHNYNNVIGPGMGWNGPGSKGIYYDWYSGNLKSTVTRGDIDYMPYGVGIDWMTISYLLSNPANIHIGMVYFTDGSKADWNLWINSDLPSGGGGSGIFDGLGFLSGITSNGANIRANDIYNSKGWRNNSGRHFSSDLLKKGANGRYVRGVQGYRNSANLARNTAQSVRMMGNTAGALGGAVIVADVLVNSEITVSNGINAFMTGISFTGIGAPIAGVWFVADFGMEIFTGRSFSERIDANTPSLDWNW
jgi:hypothetical protein